MSNPFREIQDKILQSEPVDTPELIDAYNCDLCRDTHSVYRVEITGDGPGDFVQVREWCPKCGLEYKQQLLWKQSGIHEMDRDQMFNSFDEETDVQLKAKDAVCELVEGLGVDFIILYGPSGTGKTHLGNAAVIDYIQQGKLARVVRCAEWLNELRASIDTDETVDVKAYIRKVPLLVFDELDCRTRFEWDEVVHMLGQRWADRLPTIITTNMDVSEWDSSFDRIVSRARDRVRGRMILLDGRDYRHG